MRRAKLAAGSVPAGSLPTASCFVVPRCFVCDEPIKSHRFSTSLLAGRTQYTHSPLPTKIGGYIGDEFVVVVTPQDALCKHCMALINTMDRLELELRQHRYTLTQHLKTKYKLDDHTAVSTMKKFQIVEQVEPEIIEVSDEEMSPSKKQRTESSKEHRCTICSATYTNLSLFMAHLSRHKQIASKNKTTALPFLPTVKTYVSNTPSQGLKFKCGCCSESFPTKESLALHMQQHTVTQPKPKVSCVVPSNVTRSTLELTSSILEVKPEPVVQASSLFEDIEELSHQEPQAPAPGSVGVCTEEQKGRVCLLALLNNGVCSDLSHRAPDAGTVLNSPQTVQDQPKEGVSNVGETISITVSIPSCLNGGQMTEQRLSIPAVSQHSSSTCLSYPVTFTNSQVTPTLSINSLSVMQSESNKLQASNVNSSNQNFNMNQSPRQNNCLDLPDLCGSFPDVSKSDNQVVQNSHELIMKDNGRKATPPRWGGDNPIEIVTDQIMRTPTPTVSSSGLDQSMDLPCLIEEGSNQETFVMTDQDHTFGSDVAVPGNKSGKDTKTQRENSCNILPDLTDCLNKNGTDTMKNIAISVTSVQMNKDHDENNIVTDWFYASSGKDISPVGQKENELDPSSEASWFPESDQMAISEKLLNDKCRSAGYSISSNVCKTSQKITIEGSKIADD